MSRSQIAAVACRLLAMAMFALAAVTASRTMAETLVSGAGTTVFRHLLEALPATTDYAGLSALGADSLVAGGMWVLCGVCCWLRAEKIAVQMVGDNPEPVAPAHVTAEDVLAGGFRLIGMLILVGALRTAGSLAWIFLLSEDLPSVFFKSSYGVTAVQTLLEAAFAVWLLLGTRGVVGLVFRARNAGTTRDDDVSHAEPGSETEGGGDAADGESSNGDLPGGRSASVESAADVSSENEPSNDDSPESPRIPES
jgi:hypothetical protein